MSSVIGSRHARVDAAQKVTGATRFAADLPVPGLLHARLVLASEAHAVIERISSAEALAVPGVVAVLTGADLPTAGKGSFRTNELLAHEEVVFAGQPVALVVAESEAAAEDGVEAVVVESRPLPPVVDLAAAMAPDAPLARRPRVSDEASDAASIHAGVGDAEDEAPAEELSENVLERAYFAQGDVDEVLAGSDVVVEGSFETSWVYQAYLEPQAATAWLEGDELVVSTSTQGTFFTRDELADIFGLSVAKVRVRGTPPGGAFGAKLLVVEPLAAAAALALKRPVRLVLTRSEDFAATNPAPAQMIELRVGARSGGELTAIDARLVIDRGANADWGVESISAVLTAGAYRWPAYRIRAYGVQTNRVSLGAYRAPGAPPAAFAIESLVDELAAKLGLDPIELRQANLIETGEEGVDGKAWAPTAVCECLERVREHPIWGSRDELGPDEGVGVAVAHWPGGAEPAAAACRLDADGGLTIVHGAVDITGTETGLAQIAAEAFGLPLNRVRVVAADTAAAPHAGVSGGSKITYTVGQAVLNAARDARTRLFRVAAGELEVAAEDLEVVDGVVRPVGVPDRGLPVEKLARRALAWRSRYEPIEGHGGSAQTRLAPSAAAHLAHVRVDRDTGEVHLLRYAVAQDVGRALNPALVEGQMLGGAVQGIGWALYEELVHDEQGQLLTGSFLDYATPTADRLPEIDTLIVEVPAPDGPYGAKGIGEAPVIAAPAAIANAIAAAVGTRPRTLPITPERLWRALSEPS
jgi:CO/xanthine dehydrogenase Mo-binding subunit